MDLESVLLNIKKAFIIFYGEENKDKIEKLFKELVVIQIEKNKKDFEIKNTNCDLKSRFNEKQLSFIFEDIKQFGNNTAGTTYTNSPIPLAIVRTDYSNPIATIIHEISHIMMIEDLALAKGHGIKSLTACRIQTMGGSQIKVGLYANEIINEGITMGIVEIYNKITNSKEDVSSGYTQVDNLLGNPGNRIYKELLPYIKKYMPYDATRVRKIMGNSNYRKLSELLEWQIDHIKKYHGLGFKEYNKRFEKDINMKKNEGFDLILSVKNNIKRYEEYESGVREYTEKLIAEGKAQRIK